MALRRGDQIVRNYGEKPGLFAASRIDQASGEEVLLVFNTSNEALSANVEIGKACNKIDRATWHLPLVRRAYRFGCYLPPRARIYGVQSKMSDPLPNPTMKAERPWWRGAAIYQVYPRSFADSNGDGIGDLPGITSKLDYIASLGVDAVWLSPFFTSPMKDFGYDVADYCGVDPLFGTLSDFDALVTKAHRFGLKILIDQVYSHTSDLHVMVRRKPCKPQQRQSGLVCLGRCQS